MKSALICVAFVAISVGHSTAQTDTQGIARPGGDVSTPVLIKEVKPFYSPEAMRAGIAGSVELECVVNTDGTVGEVRVVKPLEASLNEEAVKAVKQWRFKPGMKAGTPIPVLVNVEMTFTFRARGPRLDSTEVYKIGEGVTAPKVVTDIKPRYTAQAIRDRIEGTVTMECVVLPDGHVGDLRVVERLDPELDVEAIKAVRGWRFEPGTKEGKPVPVQVTLTMTFTLK